MRVVELLYKADIFRLDSLFGAVVEEIAGRGLLPDSVIAFTADHGETLYRQDSPFKWSHSYQLTQDVLRVPLLIHAPRAGLAGARYDGVTRSIDLLPTLAGLSGVSLGHYDGPGIDLSGALVAGRPRPSLVAFSHLPVLSDRMARRAKEQDLRALTSLFPEQDPQLIWVSARDDERSFILRRSDDGELEVSVYDLERDPAETIDVHDPDAPEQRAVLTELRRYRRSLIRGYEAWEGRDDALSEDERMRLLRSLGYAR